MPSFRTDYRHLLPAVGLVLIAGLSASICGCGSGRMPVAPAEGKVTYQGKPLEFGRVTFQPIGEGPSAGGDIQSDGTFVLGTYSASDGAVIGSHKVFITCNQMTNPAAGEESVAGKSLIPDKYSWTETTDLKAEVTADGPNDFPFILTDE